MVVIVAAIVVIVVVVTVMHIVVVVDDSASFRQGWRPEGGSLQERGNMPEEKCSVCNAIVRSVLRAAECCFSVHARNSGQAPFLERQLA